MSDNEWSIQIGPGMPQYTCLTQWVININRSGHIIIHMPRTTMTMPCLWHTYHNALFITCISQCLVYDIHITMPCLWHTYHNALSMTYLSQCLVYDIHITMPCLWHTYHNALSMTYLSDTHTWVRAYNYAYVWHSNDNALSMICIPLCIY